MKEEEIIEAMRLFVKMLDVPEFRDMVNASLKKARLEAEKKAKK